VVDFAYLERFAAGDSGVVKEVLKLFRASYEDWAARLTPAAPDWRDVAHTIKGAGRGVGAFALGDACETAERDGAEHLPQLRAELDAAMAEIDAYLARP
jgi:HPt (histidine-containing phosphotransfer) domain-containing protein